MEELVDTIVVGFILAIDGIKRFRYTIIAVIVCLVVLFFVWKASHDAEQACRDKGGIPISTDYDTKCASELIK